MNSYHSPIFAGMAMWAAITAVALHFGKVTAPQQVFAAIVFMVVAKITFKYT